MTKFSIVLKTEIEHLLFFTTSTRYSYPFLAFSDVKMLHSETRKGVMGKKLLGSNRPYMSYPMKFTFYLHRAYGY